MAVGYIAIGVILGIVVGYALSELAGSLGKRSQASRLVEYSNEIEDLEDELDRLREELREARKEIRRKEVK